MEVLSQNCYKIYSDMQILVVTALGTRMFHGTNIKISSAWPNLQLWSPTLNPSPPKEQYHNRNVSCVPQNRKIFRRPLHLIKILRLPAKSRSLHLCIFESGQTDRILPINKGSLLPVILL